MLVIEDQQDPNFEIVKATWSQARNVIVLTGAGISTSCGIPDFRSGEGLKKQSVRTTLQSLHDGVCDRFDFEGHPIFTKMGDDLFSDIPAHFLAKTGTELFKCAVLESSGTATAFYRFSILLKEFILQSVSQPSKLHALINQLREEGRLAHWFTQNIDGLEALSGCRIYTGLENHAQTGSLGFDPTCFDVFQMHGGLETAWCNRSCHVEQMDQEIAKSFLHGFETTCPQCATGTRRPSKPGYLRPGILLYADPHPGVVSMGAAISALAVHDLKNGADLLFIAGTSLKVYGAANLVKDISHQLRQRKKKADRQVYVIMVGNTRPPLVLHDHIDIFLEMDCDELAKMLSPVRALQQSKNAGAEPPSVDVARQVRAILLS